MKDHLSRAEIGKDVVQDTIVAAVTTAGQVGSIVTGAVREVAHVVGGFATEVFAISDAARRAALEEGRPSSRTSSRTSSRRSGRSGS